MLGSIGRQKFTKALILSGGASVVEVDVRHAAREGASRYSPLRLTRLALHVLAGFWPQPIQWVGVVLGVVCAVRGAGLGALRVLYWVFEDDFPGPLLLGMLVVFVLGVQGFILALVGEYLGRIQREVERRPLYAIDRETHGYVSRDASVESASSSPAGQGSSRRTSSATSWPARRTRWSRSTPSRTRATSRTSQT